MESRLRGEFPAKCGGSQLVGRDLGVDNFVIWGAERSALFVWWRRGERLTTAGRWARRCLTAGKAVKERIAEPAPNSKFELNARLWKKDEHKGTAVRSGIYWARYWFSC